MHQITEMNPDNGNILTACAMIITGIIIAGVVIQVSHSPPQFDDGTMLLVAICSVLTGGLAVGLSPFVFRLDVGKSLAVLGIFAVLPVIVLASHAIGSDEVPLGTWIALVCYFIQEIVIVALLWPSFRSWIPVSRPVYPLAGVAIGVVATVSSGMVMIRTLMSIASENPFSGLVLSALFCGYLLVLTVAVFLGVSGFCLIMRRSDIQGPAGERESIREAE